MALRRALVRKSPPNVRPVSPLTGISAVATSVRAQTCARYAATRDQCPPEEPLSGTGGFHALTRRTRPSPPRAGGPTDRLGRSTPWRRSARLRSSAETSGHRSERCRRHTNSEANALAACRPVAVTSAASRSAGGTQIRVCRRERPHDLDHLVGVVGQLEQRQVGFVDRSVRHQRSADPVEQSGPVVAAH